MSTIQAPDDALAALLAAVLAYDGTDRYSALLRAALAFQRAS